MQGDEPARFECPGLLEEVVQKMMTDLGLSRQVRRGLLREADTRGTKWLYRQLCVIKLEGGKK